VGYARPNDFIMLGVAQDTPSMIFISSSSPLRSFQEFLEAIKSHPGTVRVATSGVGTTDDVVLRLLGVRGYQTVNAPFSKPLERYAAISGQRALAIYEEPGYAAEFLKNQQWRPLVAVDDVRNPLFPNTPCLSEFGVTVGNIRNFRILAVSAKTPADRVKSLVEAVERSLATPEWKKYCESTSTCAKESTQLEAATRVAKFFGDMKTKLPRSAPAQGAQN
jgi:tripartite-type tricarboxylate transporter receptor subunit TctC